MKNLKPLLVVALAIVISACTPVKPEPLVPLASTKIVNFPLRLRVTSDSSGQLTLAPTNAKSANCTKFPDTDLYRKGCIVAEINEVVSIDVKMVPQNQWYFTKFQICATGVKPTDWDNCSLSTDQQSEWMVVANGTLAFPDATGQVDISTGSDSGPDDFDIINFNEHAADYFYRIRACNNEGGKSCLWMDPAAMNRGRGNRG